MNVICVDYTTTTRGTSGLSQDVKNMHDSDQFGLV